jgi:hypothetical protein
MNLSRRCEIPTTLRFFSIPSPAYIWQYIREFYIYIFTTADYILQEATTAGATVPTGFHQIQSLACYI